MKIQLSFALLSLLLVFAFGCSSKSKKDSTESSAQISGEEFGFNVQGSDSGQIAGLSSVNFAYDSSALTSAARRTLSSNADWMRRNANVTIQVEGHCDSRGSVEYNLALGERRAKAVKDYLVSLGIPARRLTIISYGKEKLLDYGDSEAAHAKNRRANFVPLSN